MSLVASALPLFEKSIGAIGAEPIVYRTKREIEAAQSARRCLSALLCSAAPLIGGCAGPERQRAGRENTKAATPQSSPRKTLRTVTQGLISSCGFRLASSDLSIPTSYVQADGGHLALLLRS